MSPTDQRFESYPLHHISMGVFSMGVGKTVAEAESYKLTGQ